MNRALKDAIENQHIGTIGLLIARNLVDLFVADDEGNLPLVLAANGRPKSLARLLHERGTMPADKAHNVLYTRSSRPANAPSMLKAAVESGNLECVQLVLDAGVDPHSVYQKNKMVFENKLIEAAVVKAAQKFSLLNALIYSDYPRIFSLLEDKAVDLSLVNASGLPALHRAVSNAVFANSVADHESNYKVIDKLLALGADPNQMMLAKKNHSILADAFITGANPVIIEKLIAAGGRVLATGIDAADILTQMSTAEYAQIEMERSARKWGDDGEKIAVAIANQEKWRKSISIFRLQLAKECGEDAVQVSKKPKLIPQIKLRR